MALSRTYYNTLVDDTGVGDGTPVDKAMIDAIYDDVDALPAAGSSFTAHGVLIGNGTGALAVTSAGTAGQVLTSNGASADPTFQTPAGGSGDTVVNLPGGRLTLTSGTPVTSSDVTGAGTLYYTAFSSNYVWLYSGSAWVAYTFTEISLALTLTSGKVYDVFLYAGGSPLAPILELSAAWTNDTTRADALATQNGLTVKSADHTRLWLGTIYASGTNTTEDSYVKRFVSNAYNAVPRAMRRLEATSTWTYSTDAWRQANGSASNQLDAVFARAMPIRIFAMAVAEGSSTGPTPLAGVGVDSTTAPATGCLVNANRINATGGNAFAGQANLHTFVVAGRHTLTWLERAGSAAGTVTWYGATGGYQTGIAGSIDG